jgi:hypothetical protein
VPQHRGDRGPGNTTDPDSALQDTHVAYGLHRVAAPSIDWRPPHAGTAWASIHLNSFDPKRTRTISHITGYSAHAYSLRHSHTTMALSKKPLRARGLGPPKPCFWDHRSTCNRTESHTLKEWTALPTIERVAVAAE